MVTAGRPASTRFPVITRWSSAWTAAGAVPPLLPMPTTSLRDSTRRWRPYISKRQDEEGDRKRHAEVRDVTLIDHALCEFVHGVFDGEEGEDDDAERDGEGGMVPGECVEQEGDQGSERGGGFRHPVVAGCGCVPNTSPG